MSHHFEQSSVCYRFYSWKFIMSWEIIEDVESIEEKTCQKWRKIFSVIESYKEWKRNHLLRDASSSQRREARALSSCLKKRHFEILLNAKCWEEDIPVLKSTAPRYLQTYNIIKSLMSWFLIMQNIIFLTQHPTLIHIFL